MDSREREMRASMEKALEKTLQELVEEIESLTQRRKKIEQTLTNLREKS